jgi:hypothetical protein
VPSEPYVIVSHHTARHQKIILRDHSRRYRHRGKTAYVGSYWFELVLSLCTAQYNCVSPHTVVASHMLLLTKDPVSVLFVLLTGSLFQFWILWNLCLRSLHSVRLDPMVINRSCLFKGLTILGLCEPISYSPYDWSPQFCLAPPFFFKKRGGLLNITPIDS